MKDTYFSSGAWNCLVGRARHRAIIAFASAAGGRERPGRSRLRRHRSDAHKFMLDFAAKFMNGKEKDDVAVRQLIQGLQGIYVRSYEFDKEGEYSMEQVESLRKSFQTPEWSPMVPNANARTARRPTFW